MLRRRNPDDQALLARVKLKVMKSRSRVTVWAYDGGYEIAKATFARAPWTAAAHEKNTLESMLTEVAATHRRRGVASLIYRTLTAQGFKIHPSSSQTWHGQQLWEGGRWPGKREVYRERYPNTWQEMVATLRENPDDQDLLRRLTVETDDDPRAMRGKRGEYVEFRVFDGEAYAAIATFRLWRKYAEEIEIRVNEPYRRRGVASWLYRWIERTTGKTIRMSKDRTSDGKAFAAGRRRNPGDPQSLEAELVKSLGVHRYTDVMRAWILADGRIIDLDSQDDDGMREQRETHGAVADLFPRAGYRPLRGPASVRDAHITFMRITGAIRLADGGQGAMFHLVRLPTPEQVTACGKIAAAHQALEQDSIEIYWQPADRLVEVSPITAGKVRRILEALPGLPPAAAPRAKPRRNPPRDVDTLEALGDECAVWAIAAATGRTVPEVRRAFLAGGDDIWLTKGGYGSGASMRQIRAVIRRLDWDHRIVGIGQALTLGYGPRAVFTQLQSDLFVRGRRRGQIGADEFDVPEGVKDDVTRSMGPEAAVREVDGVTTIGMLVDQAKRDGLSLLAVTVNARRSRGAYTFRGHIVGYAPGRGLYDTSVRSKAAVAKILDGKPSEVITGLDYAAHGDDVPQRMRPAVLWVFFKGA